MFCAAATLFIIIIIFFLFHTKDMEVVALPISNYDDGIYGRLRIELVVLIRCTLSC